LLFLFSKIVISPVWESRGWKYLPVYVHSGNAASRWSQVVWSRWFGCTNQRRLRQLTGWLQLTACKFISDLYMITFTAGYILKNLPQFVFWWWICFMWCITTLILFFGSKLTCSTNLFHR